jgi:Nucleotidyl transferase AbiEii toxin, Type IV TA system
MYQIVLTEGTAEDVRSYINLTLLIDVWDELWLCRPSTRRGMVGSKHTVMPLSDIQLRTATVILALPKAAGFALAGGAALVIHEIVDRGTKDLDCFGPLTVAVNQLVDPSLDALVGAGLQTELLLRADGFSKIVVTDENQRTQIDLGFDPATYEPVAFAIGPGRHLSDLAGDKLLALFSRAAARDFIDVAALLRRSPNPNSARCRTKGSRLQHRCPCRRLRCPPDLRPLRQVPEAQRRRLSRTHCSVRRVVARDSPAIASQSGGTGVDDLEAVQFGRADLHDDRARGAGDDNA